MEKNTGAKTWTLGGGHLLVLVHSQLAVRRRQGQGSTAIGHGNHVHQELPRAAAKLAKQTC